MCANFSQGRAAKRSKKVRGQQPGRGGGMPVGQRRIPVFELLEQREMLSGNTYTPSTSVADSHTASDNNLRSAIAAANADTGVATDTINLSSGTYTLSLSQLDITSAAHTLIIEGQGSTGPSATIIDQTALDRVFQINSGVTVIFENLKITGGTAETDSSGGTVAAEGGGILNQGNLTLDNVAVTGSTAKATLAGESAFGGGIFSTGPLTINGLTPGASLIEGNSASGFAGTDGINSGGAGFAGGGGIYSDTTGQLQITGTAISSNSATGGAGPITTGTEGDYAGYAIGGGLYTVYNIAAPTTLLDDDTIAGNQAIGGNGGTGGDNLDGGSGGYAYGAGVAVEYASNGESVSGLPVQISNSTISGNTATTGLGGTAGPGGSSAGGSDGAFGGGIENGVSGTELLNDTVSGNTVNGGSGYTAGGGIADDSRGMLIVNVTVAQNTALAGTGNASYGGGIDNGGNGDADLQIDNTLVANNTANYGTDFYGGADNPDDDLINNASGSSFVNGGGNITAPANLGIASSLANNGGNTQTLALLAGSDAIGTGDPTAAASAGLTTDQRGLPRTTAGAIDIGAYQVQAAPVTTTTALSQSVSSTSVGQSVTFTAVVSPPSGVTAAATGTVQFDVDGVGAGSPVTLSVVNGVDQATFSTSSLAAGAHVVTAIYSGDTNFLGSSSTAVNENILNSGAASSSTTIGANPDPVALGQSVTFTALVTPAVGASATPTGTVQFEVDGVDVGAETLSGVPGLDEATLSTSSLAAGSHTVTAVYLGDANFNGNVSPAISPVIVSTTYGAPVVAGPTTTAENVPVSGLVITPATNDTSVTNFQITAITGGNLYYSGGTAQIVAGQFITVASGAAGLEFIPTTNSVTNGGFTVQESTTANSGGLVGTTTPTTIGVVGTRSVAFASYYNVAGITTDGTSFGPGIDGQGDALSATALGSSVTWNGIAFAIGSANVNDVIQGTGQTIALPAGSYSSVSFLAVGTNGNQPNQQFIIHYSDGTSKTVTQSVSDWASSQGYAGESVALTTAYRNTASGGRASGTFDVYGYSITVDPNKTVEGITLPADAKVKILSIATQATLDAPTNLTATAAVNGNVDLTWTASSSTVTGYNVYRYTAGNAASPTLLSTGVTATNYTDTTATAGNTYYYVVKAVNGAVIAISPASNVASAMVAPTAVTTEVDLDGQYNLAGITSDGAGFSGGLDGTGHALSATEVGTGTTWNNVNFNIAPSGASNVIQATGQTITLPVGSYSAVDLLATGVNGNQPNQTFTVKYTDGTSTTIVRSLSDWASPQGYGGESVALATAYRNTSNGGRAGGTFNVYGYSLPVNGTKTVASITLPNNTNVDVVAISVVAAVAAPTQLTISAASSTAADLSWTAAAGTITGYNVYRGTIAGGESTTPINSSPLSAGATGYVDTTAGGGNSYYYVVKAIDGLAVSPASNEAGVAMPTSGAAIPVSLASQYNLTAITTNGSTFSGGLDGNGNALSETEVGTSVTWNGIAFAVGAPNVNDAVQSSGQSITLPAGNDSSISFLAVGTGGNQANQQFTINYSDNTSTIVTQSISDWGSAQGYAGESVAVAMAYRNTSTGGQALGTFDVYGYSIPVNPTKTVESITLPNNGNVKILSMATQATLDAPTNLAAAAAVNGNVTLTWTASASTVTSYNVYRYTASTASSPALLTSGVTGTGYTDTTSVVGDTYYYVVKAVNGSEISPASNVASATASNTATTEVDLNGQYNLTGITVDGATFSGGLDGNGNALSETEVGSSATWNGVNFNIAPTGVDNVIQATGQTITLPAGSYSAVDLLATGVNGSQLSQTFTVTYTDNTSTIITRNLSDWSSPQGYAGESVAMTTAYRNTATGGRTTGTFDVYGYSLGVDSTKTVASITLPNNSDVVVLAIDVVVPVATPTNLAVAAPSSSVANLSWTAATGTVTGYNVYRGTMAGAESTTPINSSALSASTTSYADTTAAAGNTYYYVIKAINGPAVSPASNEAGVAMPISGSTIPVDLVSDYNVTAITTNGTTETVGLDNAGNTLSETAVGSSIRWNGITFAIGAANVGDAVQGVTIALPVNNYSSLSFLAVGTVGSQASQPFTINYSDGTSTTVTQSISDWGSSQGYAGESVALSTTYRNTPAGGQAPGTYDVYGYTFALNPTKMVESITLPNNGNVKVLSMAVQSTLDAPTNLAATPAVNGTVDLTWTASDSTVTGYNVYRYTVGGAASPTLLSSNVNATNYIDTTGVAGNTYYYVVKAVTGSAISPASNTASATVLGVNPPTTEVDLDGQYNLAGITGDGAGFSGGLDGHGNALSKAEVSSGTTWNNVSFNIAPVGASNVIQATGQTITLPPGSYSAIDLLATSVNGNQPNQTFTVKYTDGTSKTFTQSLSDWAAPQGYTGESVALATAYRNTSNGGRSTGTFNVYGYSLAVNSAKTVASITLPNNTNVDVLAISVVDPVAAATSLTVAAASSTKANLSWTAATGTITGYNVYRGTTPGGESTTPINSSPLSASATSYADTTALAGNTYYYVVKAINGPAVSLASNEASVTMPTSSSTIPVDLANDYNLKGITLNGAHFSGGLDGSGNALSETEVGISQTFGGVPFSIGPATTPATNNVIQASGQTIGLPTGSYSQVEFLATAVNGGQASQTFTVKYSDGTSDSYLVSLSDWASPEGFTGETAVMLTTYRNTANGGATGGEFDVYGYSLDVNTSKTVESITLPNDKNVAVLAMTVVDVTTAAPLVTASGNTPSTFTIGSLAVPVDSQVTVSSGDADLTSATVAISPGTLQTGDLLIFNNQNNISGSYDPASGVLTLTGTASVAAYEAALQSVTFSTVSSNTATRSLTIVAHDNLLQSNTVSETVAVAT